MKSQTDQLINELETFRSKVNALISQLYRDTVKDHTGAVLSEVFLADEWEYEGQVFNALTEHGMAYIVDQEIVELFNWNDLDTESLIEVVQILEDKDFD
ncbi:hypothetical protein [Spirosoma endbachense]|uniref:Uncharacterized protein n=1 Tax=Spirosoma endbachense TaxID=2666025 RepID=A0A6P1VSK4_9BACT|nr:hypothetical protein [Spirosoma endbachense]QHV94346.1 hypothetical protein GJR95_04620 [Spirosoma endbachense]